jgi:hypothetical protein
MFIELANQFNTAFSTFTPFTTTESKPSLISLDKPFQDELISLGETYLEYHFACLSATSFMNFTRTGNRTDYEEIYFNKRRALNALVMAECIENKGRFTDSIINGIFSICEESAWQLPAHNSYIRDTPQLILPDSTLPILDLFAGETGAQLAMIRYLMNDKLNSVSPVIVKRIEAELNSRILQPYQSCHFWWMGNGDEPMCNWTIWCTQNILITAFLLPLSEEEKSFIFRKACQSVDYFLKDYGGDGCCDEGAQYYRHAGLCLFNTMEVLNAITNNHFVSLYANKKIKNIASYILNVHVSDEYYINFADCSPIAGRAGVREFLFGKRTQNSQLMKFAAMDYKADPNQLLTEEINLFYRIQAAFSREEILAYDTTGGLAHQDIYYESVGIFKVHDTNTCLAVKSGDNDDSHNHNDTGSFTIYKNNKPLFIDAGVESYSKKTFSPQRYEIWTMQSSYHNLPEIDHTMQMNGSEYKTVEVQTTFEEKQASISMNIAPAYPLKKLEYYNRTVTLNRNKNIVLTDSWSGCQDVVLNFLTYNKPVIYSTNLILIGSLGTAHMEGAAFIDIEEIPITDKRLQIAWKHNIYRIKITATHNSFLMTIE